MYIFKIHSFYSMFLVFSLIPNAAFANDKIEGIYFKSLLFVPKISARLSYDDNIFSQEKKTQRSLVSELTPELGVIHENRFFKADLKGNIKKRVYHHHSDENFIDNSIAGNLYLNLGGKGKIEFGASIDNVHEEKGTGYSQNYLTLDQERNRFLNYNVISQITYGNKESSGRIKLVLNAYAQRIDNNLSIAHSVNRDEFTIKTIAYLRSNPGNIVFIEPSLTKVDYRSEHGDSTLDNLDYRLYTGVETTYSPAIQGVLKVGLQKKKFEIGDKSKSIKFAWSFTATWRPVNYSQFFLTTESNTEDSTGFGDSVDVVRVSGGWQHDFSGKYTLESGADISKHNYNPGSSAEGNIQVRLSLSYRIRDNMNWVIGGGRLQRLSTRLLKDFERNQVFMLFKWSFN